MKLWSYIINIVGNLAKVANEMSDLAVDIVGDKGLRTTVNTSFEIVNESLDRSKKMSRIEGLMELKEFTTQHKLTKAQETELLKGY